MAAAFSAIDGPETRSRRSRSTPAVEIARTLKSYFPDVGEAIFAAAIERYRKLGLWGPDPVIRREGFDRLHAAMRAFGTLKRDIPYEVCVDTSLAERARS
jgi:NitT/TauT family transport system substrate-binding protein